MSPRSLRLRLAVTSALAICVALAAAGWVLVMLFERQLERRAGVELDRYLDRISAQVAFDETGALSADVALSDPRFEEIFGGLYWRLLDERTGDTARSRSLWDHALPPLEPAPPPGDVIEDMIAGPLDTTLLARERRLIVAQDGERVIRVAAAIDRGEIDALRASYAWEVAASLAVLALFLATAAVVQAQIGLQPLQALRQGVAAIRTGRALRLDRPAPSEIEPLVDEINALLALRDDAARRARERATDLAHGFKTPLSSLQTDVERLRKNGQDAIAEDVELTLRLMRRQIDRELARARLRDHQRAPAIDPGPLLDGLARTLRRTPAGEAVEISLDIAPRLTVRAEIDDLADALGNLMENAVRHAAGRVRITARAAEAGAEFIVEDDGPGVPEEQCAAIIARGARLDQTGSGAGIGLAIVRDLLEHYDAALSLGRSELGGLRAGFVIPTPVAPPAKREEPESDAVS